MQKINGKLVGMEIVMVVVLCWRGVASGSSGNVASKSIAAAITSLLRLTANRRRLSLIP
jgi:hypothetical protein